MAAARRSTGVDPASGQVARLLALVPYVARRPGVSISELAAEFDVTAAQITKDLNLLMVCGEPGYYPDELIDVVFDDDDGTVSIAYDAGMARPVRLRADEAVALTAALGVLAELPGHGDHDAARSALAKLENAAGEPVPAVRVAPPDPAPALARIREALGHRRRVRTRYYTASRDAMTQRDVDPVRLVVADGHTYLEGYCHTAEATRWFRADRIDDIRILDEAALAPAEHDPGTGEVVFDHSGAPATVTLRLAPSVRWVAEYYITDEVREIDDPAGWWEARLPAADDAWIVRLVLSCGGEAQIVDRPDLAERVRARAVAALAWYDGGPRQDAARG